MGDLNGSPLMLTTNDNLISFCDALASPDAQVTDLGTDLVYDADSCFPFPAAEKLLMARMASLHLKCGNFPWLGVVYVLNGLARLRGDLHRLALRFEDCEIKDGGYSFMF
jgi:hypothetical protein